MFYRKILFAFSASLLTIGHAYGQAACNCSKHVGECHAVIDPISHENAHIRVNTPRCALVSYSVNGNPTATPVTGGSGDQTWLDVADGVNPVYEDCVICASGDEAANPRGVKLNVKPTGRTNRNLDEVGKEVRKLQRPGS
jgi:hypothetical protein